VRSRGQAAAIVIRETQPTSTKLTPQKPILFDQVRDGLPLPAVQPAGQNHKHHLPRSGVGHEPELISCCRDGCRPSCGTLRDCPSVQNTKVLVEAEFAPGTRRDEQLRGDCSTRDLELEQCQNHPVKPTRENSEHS
jgi:hypothetical protein